MATAYHRCNDVQCLRLNARCEGLALPGVVKRRGFGGKVVYTKVLARFWPPVAPLPARAGRGTIGGQDLAKTYVYTTFLPKPYISTTPGNEQSFKGPGTELSTSCSCCADLSWETSQDRAGRPRP